jgi:hypothetical protein
VRVSCGCMEVCVRRVLACWFVWAYGGVCSQSACVLGCVGEWRCVRRGRACVCVRVWTCACVDVCEPRACMTLWVRYVAAALVP